MPDKRTTSCRRCRRSLMEPNRGMMQRTSKLLSLALMASRFTISENSVNSKYGDISLAMKRIRFLADICGHFGFGSNGRAAARTPGSIQQGCKNTEFRPIQDLDSPTQQMRWRTMGNCWAWISEIRTGVPLTFVSFATC